MSIGARVIRAVALQQIDHAPHAKASAERDNEEMCIRDRDKPAGFIKDGFHGKLAMLKKQVLLGGSVVGVFRVDMLECCQLRHLLS